MAYLLKARTVEPEKQLLLVNGSETTFVSRQQLGKHIPVATDMHATRGTDGNCVFYSVCPKYKEDNWGNEVTSVSDAVMKWTAGRELVGSRCSERT
jgi:hypothetical protein